MNYRTYSHQQQPRLFPFDSVTTETADDLLFGDQSEELHALRNMNEAGSLLICERNDEDIDSIDVSDSIQGESSRLVSSISAHLSVVRYINILADHPVCVAWIRTTESCSL